LETRNNMEKKEQSIDTGTYVSDCGILGILGRPSGPTHLYVHCDETSLFDPIYCYW